MCLGQGINSELSPRFFDGFVNSALLICALGKLIKSSFHNLMHQFRATSGFWTLLALVVM